MFEIHEVTKSYGKQPALRGVSLELRPGEFFGLLGPNGAGKSTLMSILCGFLAPDGGSIRLRGEPFRAESRAQRALLGLVPQALALYEDISAAENLRIFGGLYGLSGKTLEGRVREVLAMVQLADRARDAVKSFSGGMKRRLNIAAALLHRPAVLLCDEPTVGVDPQSRNAIFEFLQQLNREGLTIIYTTHYMEEAEKLCQRIGIIDEGRILALGTLDELLQKLPFVEEIEVRRSPEVAPILSTLASFGNLVEGPESTVLQLRDGERLSSVFATVEQAGLPARALTMRRPTLEALFLHLTGKSLRE